MKGYYRSIRRSMMLAIVLASYAPLLLLSAIGGYQFHTAYKSKVLDHIEELVLNHKRNINGFLGEKLAEIRVIADITEFSLIDDEHGLETVLRTLQERHGGVFVDLGLVNAQGVQVAYAGPFKLGRADYADALWFKEAMQRRYYISDVFLGLRGLPHFILAVKQHWEGHEWILRSTIDFVAFNQLVENIRIGKTGLAYIINSKGEFQTQPRMDVRTGLPLILEHIRKQDNSRSSQENEALPGARGFTYLQRNVSVTIETLPESGVREIFVTTPLKGGDWTLVYQQDVADAFSQFYHARNIAMVGVILAGAAILIVAYILSGRMVARISEADKQKEMMNEQIIEAGKLASVGELAAGIAHEINNPVAIMVEEAGWIQDLMEDDELKALEDYQEVMRALNQIRTQGTRCKEITHKLLSFARKIDPTVKKVAINDLIEEMAALSEQRAKYSNVTISTNLSPGLPMIAASPSEMQQVFLNFINNAIDAMEKGGGTLSLSTRRENDFIVISVADSGEGIPRAILQRIFDPFFTTKPVGKGTGLGLSICYGIIQKMGGEITVNSSVGVGTTFNVKLPIHSDVEIDEPRPVNPAECPPETREAGTVATEPASPKTQNNRSTGKD